MASHCFESSIHWDKAKYPVRAYISINAIDSQNEGDSVGKETLALATHLDEITPHIHM